MRLFPNESIDRRVGKQRATHGAGLLEKLSASLRQIASSPEPAHKVLAI
jgi:hypothetical protein